MHLNNLVRARSRDARAAGIAYRRARGFSLMEVMVALVVSTIGLLGLAKMEALAMSSTGIASSRSLAAIEASSLAAAMHANPGFWQAGTAPASIPISGDATTNPYAGTPPCTATAPCQPQAMAYNDMNQWAAAVSAVLPGYLATITCTQAFFPVTCTIQLEWTENGVAVNTQQTQMSGLATPKYILYVQP
jgi:type IV pilus assembly protein PilV